MQAKQADGARRSVRNVLQYLIAIPEVKDAIKRDGSKIKLRFAADGRRTSKRIGTVMAVFNILCENKATYEYQYTLALYNGKCRDSNILTSKFLSNKSNDTNDKLLDAKLRDILLIKNKTVANLINFVLVLKICYSQWIMSNI